MVELSSKTLKSFGSPASNELLETKLRQNKFKPPSLSQGERSESQNLLIARFELLASVEALVTRQEPDVGRDVLFLEFARP